MDVENLLQWSILQRVCWLNYQAYYIWSCFAGGGCEDEIHGKGVCHEDFEQMGNVEKGRGIVNLVKL